MILNIFKETYQILRLNWKRTVLTGLTVAWGIFMLIALLGLTNGLIHGFNENMNSGNANTVTIYRGVTTMEHNGYQAGRRIDFSKVDIKNIEKEFSPQIVNNISYFTSTGNTAVIKTLKDCFNTRVYGVFPLYRTIEDYKIKSGRYINEADIKQHRKVAVLTQKACDMLFRNNNEAIGKQITIDDIVYKVVGVIGRMFDSGESNIHIPITTYHNIYENTGKIPSISFTTKGLTTELSNKKFEEDMRALMAKQHNFNVKDRSAIWIRNRFTQRLATQKSMSLLTIAAWVIGILSLISGIVGVSNIMFISVKERTHEIGIRRAIGAKPSNIYMMIIIESVSITTFFGYLGMTAGVAMNQIANHFANIYGTNKMGFTMFSNPTVGIDIAIEATITMIIAGIIAGMLPARRATKIRPVEALMDE